MIAKYQQRCSELSMKNIAITSLVVLPICIFIIVSNSRGDQKEPAAKFIKQGEFARLLVEVLDLTKQLPPSATREDYAHLLVNYKIEPLGGWSCDRILTRNALAVILVRALNLQSQIKDVNNIKEYLRLLTDLGIPLLAQDLPLTLEEVTNIFNEEAFSSEISKTYRRRATPI